MPKEGSKMKYTVRLSCISPEVKTSEEKTFQVLPEAFREFMGAAKAFGPKADRFNASAVYALGLLEREESVVLKSRQEGREGELWTLQLEVSNG